MTKLVITTGEPAGIGPEVSVKAAWKSTAPIILVGDREMLLRQAVQLGLSAEPPANISFEHVPLGTTVHAGVLDVRNSPYVHIRSAFQALMRPLLPPQCKKASSRKPVKHLPATLNFLSILPASNVS